MLSKHLFNLYTFMSSIIISSGQQVETFEIEDASHSDATTMAADSEAIELITSLGLTGQQTLVNGATVTRLPYRALEKREQLVYRALCDATSLVEAFNAETIPLRVLQVISHAKETELFNHLEVWYPKTYKVDDPVLLGVKKVLLYPDKPQYSNLTSDVYYLLARWGKCLLPFEQLEAMAVEMLRKVRATKLNELKVQATSALEVTKESNDLEYLSKDISSYGLTNGA